MRSQRHDEKTTHFKKGENIGERYMPTAFIF